MTEQTASDVYYDPYDVDIVADPYPVYRRLAKKPLSTYNKTHDFFAASQFADVEQRPARLKMLDWDAAA